MKDFQSNSMIITIICLIWLKSASGNPLLTSNHGMPTVQSIDVKCGRNGMNVQISFDRVFDGVVYSKGHYGEPKCTYIDSRQKGNTEYNFQIPSEGCETDNGPVDSDSQKANFVNTIVIQNDFLVQEIWDSAVRLSCSVKDTFSKSVETKPITIQNPEMVNVVFDARSVNNPQLIPLQTSSFTSASTYISREANQTLLILLKDSSGKFDANVVYCRYGNSKDDSAIVVDKNGCLVQRNAVTSFSKMRDPQDFEADLVFYSYIKNLNVEDPNFRLSCQLEVCEQKCLEPCILGPYSQFRN